MLTAAKIKTTSSKEHAGTAASKRVSELLRSCGIEPPDGLVFHRVYGGWGQRKAGAWSWFALAPRFPGKKATREVCGSHHPLSKLHIGEIEVTVDSATKAFCMDPKPLTTPDPKNAPKRVRPEMCWWLVQLASVKKAGDEE